MQNLVCPPARAAVAVCAILLLVACRDQTPLPTAGLATAPEFPLGAVQPVDGAINPSDTWVTYDATREQVTNVSLNEPVVDAATLQPTTALTLTQVPQVLHTEAGYDVGGTIRVNEYRQAPAVDPYVEPVDETQRVQVVGDQVTGYGFDGEVTVAAQEADVPGAPLAELGSLAGAQVTQGVIISKRDVETIIMHGISPNRLPVDGEGESTTRVERLASGRIRLVTHISTPGSAQGVRLAASQAQGQETRMSRRYAPRGEQYVLEELDVETRSANERGQMTSRQTTRIRNLRWHENRQKDAERRVVRERERAVAPAPGPPAPSMEEVCYATDEVDLCNGSGVPGGEPPPPPPPSTDPCAGANPAGRNVVFQHGIFSSGATWSRMVPWLSSDFYLGCTLVPSLDSNARLASQAGDLQGHIHNTGRTGFVVIGHSQGGLIARRVAQDRPYMVNGVVTIGTPHHGAPITATPRTAVLAGLGAVAALTVAGCTGGSSFAGCSRTGKFVAFGVPMLAAYGADWANPVFDDLRPGSSFQHQLNGYPETFPRVGIQHFPKKLWVEWRLYGDNNDVPDGVNGGRREAKRANAVFLTNTACGVVGWLIGFAAPAGRCATRAGGMLATTAFWNVLTARLGKTDGIVPGQSQIYPNALRNITIPNGDSHVGETRSEKTRDALRTSLSINMQVQKKDTW